MNFLAHLFLSGDNDNVKLGNFIADTIKGKKYNDYPSDIKQGILLHRYIDDFTDRHEIIKKSKSLFTASFHKHNGIVIDILFDHFLIVNWNKFSNTSHTKFINHSFMILLANYNILPPRAKKMLVPMILNKWFKSYETIDGVCNILKRMSKFTSLPENDKVAKLIIKKSYKTLNSFFLVFFDEIIIKTNKFRENYKNI